MVFPPPTPMLRKILIGLCGGYIVSMLGARMGAGVFITHLDLQPSAVVGGELWRLFSYGLLHEGVGHLIGNLLLFYFFGLDIEQQFGGKRLLTLTALCIVGGGVLATLSALVGLSPSNPVIGASAGGLGLLVCWSLIHARRTIRLFGIIPLTGKQLLYLSVGFEILLAVSPGGASSSAAHLGGMVTGWALITGGINPKRWRQKARLASLRRQMKKKRQPKLDVIKGGKTKDDQWLN
jgi:membrane associated rhomboid family serine protease